MPHIITGEIRKDVYTKEGSGNKGNWKMYAVDLSERYKDKDGQPQYTNYRATFFASDNMRQWYDEAFQKGKVISISCDVLAVNQRENNGTNYITLEPQMPKLVFSQRSSDNGSGNRQSNGGGQQQSQPQRQQQQQNPQGNNQPPMDFDDDIPF